MNEITASAIRIAETLAHAGFTIPAIEVRTPDGRSWNIAMVHAGRGRRDDGSWGTKSGAPYGFRLFEIDHETGCSDEHDAIDSDTWPIDDLLDYLRAVGQPKDTTSGASPSNKTTT
ncbi:MAG: hypothetical protein KF757_04525 [Phycisphaeraceae bacterium]|nr:hypothetical protein [Phycisphaeraceae bacterium]